MKLALQLLLTLCLGLTIVSDHPSIAANIATAPQLQTIPGVAIGYYQVIPRENEGLMDAVLRLGPRDSGNNPRVAVTHWRIEWQWPSDRHAKPLLENTQVTFVAKILLPKLGPEANLNSEQKFQWQKYLSALEIHEAGHAWQAYLGANQLQMLIRNSAAEDPSFSPLQLNQLAEDFVAKLHAADRLYDQTSGHGYTQGVCLDCK